MTTVDNGKPVVGKALTPTTRPHAAVSPTQGPRTLDSRELLAGQSTVLIEHMGEIYRLQTTRQGKLILTK